MAPISIETFFNLQFHTLFTIFIKGLQGDLARLKSYEVLYKVRTLLLLKMFFDRLGISVFQS